MSTTFASALYNMLTSLGWVTWPGDEDDSRHENKWNTCNFRRLQIPFSVMLPLKADYINPDDINGCIARPRCNHRQRYRAVTSTAHRLQVIYWSFLRCVPGPQRTSPTVPKNMPTPQRVQHNTPAMRKNPSLSRNGGSDAEIMELNQQVELYLLLHTSWTLILRRILKRGVVFLFSSWWS